MSSSIHTILTPLAILFTITHLTSAQQPTPYIPATHTGYSSPSPITSQTPHFLPPLSPSFRLLNSKEEYAASIYLALTSVQLTWTAGPEYPRIISAIHKAAPTSLYPSLMSSGYNWPAIVTASWYGTVGASIRSQISVQESALQSAFDSMVAQVNAEAEKEAETECGVSSNTGLGKREMLENGWALGMGMGMGFVVRVWSVGGF